MNETVITPPLTKLYGLDHLRALAITLVFVYHYGHLFPHPEWTNAVSEFGWTGVDLFFVLSGYLISAQLFADLAQGKKISFRIFYLKRFFKIIPPYLVVVAFYFCFPFIREREALAPLWKYLTFTQNLGLDLRTQGTFSHAWSLCIEEQFYLFLPLILAALSCFNVLNRGFILLIGLFLIGLILRFYVYQTYVEPFSDDDDWGFYWYKWIYYPTYSRLDGLLIGVGIAALCQFKPKIKARISKFGNLLLLIGFGILAAAYFLCSDPTTVEASVLGFPLISIGYGLMVFGAISPKSFLYTLSSKMTTFIATLSYSLYLTHKFLIHLTQELFLKWGFAQDSNWVFLICLFTSVLGAFLMNLMVEKPFLQLRDKIVQKY